MALALALATAPIPLSVAATMPMQEKMAAQGGAVDHCGCEKGDADCAKSEACFAKCATTPALEPKRANSRVFVFAAATIEGLDPSQLHSLLTPPPHPPPRG